MIIPERIDSTFIIFSKILPIHSDAQKRIIKKRLDIDLEDILPTIMKSLAQDCKNPEYREQVEGYFKWILDACLYILGESDQFPETIIESSSITVVDETKDYSANLKNTRTFKIESKKKK